MQPISVYPTTKTPKRQNVDNTGRNFMRERERERERDKTNKTQQIKQIKPIWGFIFHAHKSKDIQLENEHNPKIYHPQNNNEPNRQNRANPDGDFMY